MGNHRARLEVLRCTEHLAEIYGEVGTDPYSMVVGCAYDPDTEGIVSTNALTQPLPHED